MLIRVASFALVFALALPLTATAGHLTAFVFAPETNQPAVAVDVNDDLVMNAWVQDGEIQTMCAEGDVLFGEGDHGPGEQPQLCGTHAGIMLAWIDGGQAQVRRFLDGAWDGPHSVHGNGLPLTCLSLTGWQPALGYDFPDAYLCWQEADGTIWIAVWSVAYGWSYGAPVLEAGGYAPARPRALPVLTDQGVQPRIYYLEDDLLRYVEYDQGAWTEPVAVADGHPFGTDFALAAGPGFSQHVLSLGPPPACPCNVIHYTEAQPGGPWLEPEQLTLDLGEFDWPQAPSLGVGQDGRVHAFWYQDVYDDELYFIDRVLHYQLRLGGVWSDHTALLEDHVGDACALATEPETDATLMWRECHEYGCELWLYTGAIVTGVGDTPAAGTALEVRPNPFNPRTTFSLQLPPAGAVSLQVFDATGRRVRTLLDGSVVADGVLSVEWDGRDDAGRALPSGVYLARAAVDGVPVGDRKVVLVR